MKTSKNDYTHSTAVENGALREVALKGSDTCAPRAERVSLSERDERRRMGAVKASPNLPPVPGIDAIGVSTLGYGVPGCWVIGLF